MKIVWISRHNLTAENIEILKKAFGEFEVHQVKDTVDSQMLRELAEKFKDAKFVVVLPPHLIMELLRYTQEVYRFVVERKVDDEGNVEVVPIGLEKIEKIEIVTKRIV